MSKPVAQMTKETIHRAGEVSLAEGLRFERRVFHAMFAMEDQKEGMAAFVEKRPPAFKHPLSKIRATARVLRAGTLWAP